MLSRLDRRRLLQIAGSAALPGIGGSAAASEAADGDDDRSGDAYAGGGSISSADELARAISTPSFYDAISDSTWVGKFAQGEVLPEGEQLLEFPTDGSTFGIVSSGMAENVPADDPGSITTFFSDGAETGLPNPGTGQTHDVAYLSVDVEVPEDPDPLSFDYRFATEELPVYEGSRYQDFFVAVVEYPDGTTENVARLPDGDPVTVDNVVPYASESDAVSTSRLSELLTNEVDVSGHAGETLTVTFGVADVGDAGLDSAVLLDAVGFGAGRPPEVVGVGRPVSAVRATEGPALSVDVDPGSADPDALDLETSVTLRDDGDSVGTADASVSRTTTDDGVLRLTATAPPSVELPGPEYGLEYVFLATLTRSASGADASSSGGTSTSDATVSGTGATAAAGVASAGDVGRTVTASTFSFETVLEAGLVAARATDQSPDDTGTDLRNDLDEKLRFANEYYASELGTMGAVGWDVDVLTPLQGEAVDDGWLVLDDETASYEAFRAVGFVREALRSAESAFDVEIADDYDKAIVVSPELIGTNNFYRGNIFPANAERIPVTLGEFTLSIPISPLIPEEATFEPYDLESGPVDAVYQGYDVPVLRHELAHTYGPGNRIGPLDLYYAPLPVTIGTINEWGLMGGGDNLSGYTRWVGRDPWSFGDGFLDGDATVHLEDATVDLEPLTDKEVGDDLQFVVSVFAEFSVDIGPLSGVDVTPVDFKVVPYIVEARRGGVSSYDTPFSNQNLRYSPAGEDGVALYRFGLLEVGSESALEGFLGGNPLALDNAEFLDLDFLSRDGQIDADELPRDPTLSLQNDGHDSWYDPVTATEFTMTEGFDSPTVELDRNVTDLVIPDVPYLDTVIAKAGDFFDGLAELAPAPPGEEGPLPPLDLLVETGDGRRVGTDPATGEVVNEVEGARVFGTGDSRGVVVPGGVEFDVTVADDRLRTALEDQGYEPPASVPYDLTVISDAETTVESGEVAPRLAGRVRQRVTTETGDGESPAQPLTTVDADVDPDRINAGSRGEFVTAAIEVPEGVDAADLHLETVAASGVPAVTDDRYGFVEEPPVEVRDGTEYVLVKFPRAELVDALGTGDHSAVLTGVFDRTSVRAVAPVTVFERGPGR